ncbi:flagellar hook-length control protein FliK [Variovorax sp. RHLX14]|uniref:flagellar hook-length control protein FliK n=1 Tax=Variovorax sp. RHLX14 TaxID=1259731 RepID=UPI003F47B727
MAIELANVAPAQPKANAGRAPGRETSADGEGSFASALSASTAAPAPSRSATKKPEANERSQDKRADIGGSGGSADGVDGVDGVDRAGAAAVVPEVADATEVSTEEAADPGAAVAATVEPAGTPQLDRTASPPLPAESAMLLAQGALTGAVMRDATERAAAVPSRLLASTDKAPVIAMGDLPPATAQAPVVRLHPLPAVQGGNAAAAASAAGAGAGADLVADPALQAISARDAVVRAAPAAVTPAGTATTEIGTRPTSAAALPTGSTGSTGVSTAAIATSFSSTLAQQAQHATAQTQAQVQAQAAQSVADRAALQSPAAALESRAAESLAASAASAATSADVSSSPLLRRFERVLSMTQGASGEGQVFGSGSTTTTSTWMTPVNGAAAGTGASMGGMADRLADGMNGLLAQVMAQKNHNASLTVDVGGQPVSVNVQVQGNEAQVVFRADQAETRAMLAQALPQLKQMMGAEGLVLSDASVAGQWTGGGAQAGAGGSSGSNGAGDSDARRGTTSAVRPDKSTAGTGAAAGSAARTAGSRSLDLYV